MTAEPSSAIVTSSSYSYFLPKMPVEHPAAPASTATSVAIAAARRRNGMYSNVILQCSTASTARHTVEDLASHLSHRRQLADVPRVSRDARVRPFGSRRPHHAR